MRPAPRGQCSVCGAFVSLLRGGVVRKHHATYDGRVHPNPCGGSGCAPEADEASPAPLSAPDLIAIANKLRSASLVLGSGAGVAAPCAVIDEIVAEIDAWEASAS